MRQNFLNGKVNGVIHCSSERGLGCLLRYAFGFFRDWTDFDPKKQKL